MVGNVREDDGDVTEFVDDEAVEEYDEYDSEIDVALPMSQHVPERNEESLYIGDGASHHDSVSDQEEILLFSE